MSHNWQTVDIVRNPDVPWSYWQQCLRCKAWRGITYYHHVDGDAEEVEQVGDCCLGLSGMVQDGVSPLPYLPRVRGRRSMEDW